jgi:thioredoxin-related protein
MKKYIFIILLSTLAASCAAHKPYGSLDPQKNSTGELGTKDSAIGKQAPIVWLDFESGYAKAIKENKILLVDVYTDWCGWCKVMDRKTYTNDTVLHLIKSNYVVVKLNPEKDHTYVLGDKTYSATELHAWLGYGKTFGYPTTYFWLKPGKTEERYASIGYNESWDFISILTQVKSKNGN